MFWLILDGVLCFGLVSGCVSWPHPRHDTSRAIFKTIQSDHGTGSQVTPWFMRYLLRPHRSYGFIYVRYFSPAVHTAGVVTLLHISLSPHWSLLMSVQLYNVWVCGGIESGFKLIGHLATIDLPMRKQLMLQLCYVRLVLSVMHIGFVMGLDPIIGLWISPRWVQIGGTMFRILKPYTHHRGQC